MHRTRRATIFARKEMTDGGRKLTHQQFNQGSDGKEHLLMELILVRKSARK